MTLPVNVANACQPPANAVSYVLNATAIPVNNGYLGLLNLWSYNQQQPNTSVLNAFDGAITNNMAISRQTSGYIDAYASNSTNLLLDVFGYFANINSVAAGDAATLDSCANTPSAVCQLSAGPYTIANAINIATNVSLSGSTDPNNPTFLIRGQSLTDPIMEIGAYSGSSLTGIYISNITFCGASTTRQGDPNNRCPPNFTATVCEQSHGCRPDLFITNTTSQPQPWATGPATPFANSGPYSVVVTNSYFEDGVPFGTKDPAPRPVFISPISVGQNVNDVLFTNNVISGGGVQLDSYIPGGPNYEDYTQCDNWNATQGTSFADDPAVTIPRNIRFDSNTYYINAGAVSGAGRYVQFTSNTINGYYFLTSGGGGAVEQESCGDQILITKNTLNGYYTQNADNLTSGMELYSRNLTVSQNTVSGYGAEGIGVFNSFASSVVNNALSNNNRSGFGAEDVRVATRYPGNGSACNPNAPCNAVRDTQALTVSNNTGGSNQPYAINLIDGGEGSTNTVTLSAISNNSLSASYETAVDKRVSVNASAINPSPVIITSSLLPETIAIFPEGNQPLGAPLGTDDPGATNPPARNRRFFRFGGNDPSGPANFNGYYYVNTGSGYQAIYGSIQGFLSTATNASGTGGGGPYTSGALCHFAYFPGPGLVYLDGTYNSSWVGSSPLGSQGHDLSNQMCVIHAGTSRLLQNSSNSTNNLSFILDIEFLQSGPWFMYESAANQSGAQNQSNGGASEPWSLWGFWPVPAN